MKEFISQYLKYFVCFLSAGLFLACMPMPAIKFLGGAAQPSGGFFIIGWLGPLAGHFEWYANPLLLIAMIFLLKNRPTISCVLSLISLLLIFATQFRGCIIRDEGGACQAVAGYLIGWWLWVASAATLLIGSLFQGFIIPKAK